MLGKPTTLALTATAAPPVRAEIVERLALDDPAEIVRGFDRPNIHLSVEHHTDDVHKGALRSSSTWSKGSARRSYYVATRRRSDELAAALRDAGVSAPSVPRRASTATTARPPRPRSCMTTSRWSSPRSLSAWALTSRTFAPSCTPRSATPSTPTTRDRTRRS
jgi:hypothetical protein